MLIFAQNKKSILNSDHIIKIFADQTGKIRCRCGNETEELARYENPAQTDYVLEALMLSSEQGDKAFYFPNIEQTRKNMSPENKRQTSFTRSTNNGTRHGGS